MSELRRDAILAGFAGGAAMVLLLMVAEWKIATRRNRG